MSPTVAARAASAITRWDHAVARVRHGRITVDRTRWMVSHSRALLDRPRPPFGGGSDSAPDEATVRGRVRDLIDTGVLPRFSSGTLISGPCRVAHNCTVCGGGIKVGEKEVELVSRTGAVVIYLHRPCLDIWTQEATDGDRPPRL
jgi:hypothetical protein